MSEHRFRLYEARQPTHKLAIYCSSEFVSTVSAIYREDVARRSGHIANGNELVKRLASGQTLSSHSFRQEPPGYAIRSGQLRFYGVYSQRYSGTFVLSHCVWKTWQKLRPADSKKMEDCLAQFDKLKSLPI